MVQSLKGVRVVDLSRLLPGPFCSRLLADLGAEVIKVEEPGMGDYARWMPPHFGETSALFAFLNHGKKSVGLDLKRPEAREALLRLLDTADVLLESFRPGVPDRLGLGYAALKARNPRLVYCSITGYGQDGPYRHRAGHDMNYLGYAGALGLTGPAGGAPVVPAIQIADLAGGAYPAAVGILAALLGRGKTGEGCFVDISMTEGALALLGPLYAALGAGDPEPERGRMPLTGKFPCYRIYQTRDGRSLAVGALEPKFFEKLCEAIGRPDLAAQGLAEGEQAERVAGELQQIFGQKDLADWSSLLDAFDACATPALEPREVYANPQHVARGAFLELAGAEGVLRIPASPIREAGRRPEPPASPPPALGQHTDEIFLSLGLPASELARLRDEGALA